MKLEILKIKGFRKLNDVDLTFGDATFMVGENNVGKSSIFKAIELILTNTAPKENDYSKIFDPKDKSTKQLSSEIELTATFRDIPDEADNWVGFKGRIFLKDGIRKIIYRKTYPLNSKDRIEIFEQEKELKSEIQDGNKVTIASLISSGIDEQVVNSHFEGIDVNQNLSTAKYKAKLDSFIPAWDFKDEFSWVENPGGIPQNIISKLPKFILIPAEHKADEINSDKKTALGEVMTTIFEDIVETSENFVRVQEYFSELEKEVDTANVETEFGKLMVSVNDTIKNIFPDSTIYAKVNLSDPKSFLKPNYDIQLGSNILTDIAYQGTGMVRSTAFSLLKFREDWKKERERDVRNLVIGFEEPELFLHPNAANQMRETIYELAGTSNQIVCTSHSPYMIDLSRENERQVINNISIQENSFVKVIPFSVTEKFLELQGDNRQYVKMLLKIDDYIARAFFAKKIIIVEGDTEDVVLRKTLDVLDKSSKNKIKSDVQIIKARGKATIPPLVKYFKALGIENLFVIHDKDEGVKVAEDVNPRILEALGDENNRIMLEQCIEDVLEYDVPSSDKPFKAFKQIENWKNINDLPEKWKNIIENIFRNYLT